MTPTKSSRLRQTE
jgi:hypothetical protein